MVQEQKAKQKASDEQVEQVEAADATNAELAQKTDEVLDSIDDVLEELSDADLLADLDGILGSDEEAEQMVANFIQQGGQ